LPDGGPKLVPTTAATAPRYLTAFALDLGLEVLACHSVFVVLCIATNGVLVARNRFNREVVMGEKM